MTLEFWYARLSTEITLDYTWEGWWEPGDRDHPPSEPDFVVNEITFDPPIDWVTSPDNPEYQRIIEHAKALALEY